MDSIDKGILNHMANNCRITYRELSLKFNISSSAIKKRVKKLEESGIIEGYGVNLSRAMTGTNLLFGFLATDGSQDEQDFVNTLGKQEMFVAAASYTGGHYALIAEYRNSQDLWELGAFLRNFDCVLNIETHQLLSAQGSTMELTKLHLRVINVLLDDPRMSIVDIAEKTGLTSRRVRRLVNELVEGQAVIFRSFNELGAAGSIPFLMWITWNEKETDHNAIRDWLDKTFKLSLWESFISAEAPIMICLLSGEDLTEVDSIARATRRHPHIPTVTVQISKHHRYFPGLSYRILLKTLEEAGVRRS
ncbi:MAG: winged helix-turn-helix transcriptional regulator [Candidatus Odinarchaeota archaeon]